jgi:hypothetical protein
MDGRNGVSDHLRRNEYRGYNRVRHVTKLTERSNRLYFLLFRRWFDLQRFENVPYWRNVGSNESSGWVQIAGEIQFDGSQSAATIEPRGLAASFWQNTLSKN